MQTDEEAFGVDASAGLPAVDDLSEGVLLPPTLNPLQPDILVIFQQRICTEQQTNLWDTEPYLQAVRTLNDLLGHAR